MAELADALHDNGSYGHEQDNGVDQRDEYRAFLVTIGISGGGVPLGQLEGEEREEQAEDVAQVVPRVGEQAQGVLVEANSGFHDDEQQVQHDGGNKNAVQRANRVCVMMFMSACHIELSISSHFHREGRYSFLLSGCKEPCFRQNFWGKSRNKIPINRYCRTALSPVPLQK